MSKKIIATIMFVLCVSFSSNLPAEEQKMTPEQQQQMMQQTMQSMVPFMGQMMKMMMEVQLEVLADPKTADSLATYTRNYYDALIKKGFTKDEALKIAMNMGIPSLPNMQQ